ENARGVDPLRQSNAYVVRNGYVCVTETNSLGIAKIWAKGRTLLIDARRLDEVQPRVGRAIFWANYSEQPEPGQEVRIAQWTHYYPVADGTRGEESWLPEEVVGVVSPESPNQYFRPGYDAQMWYNVIMLGDGSRIIATKYGTSFSNDGWQDPENAWGDVSEAQYPFHVKVGDEFTSGEEPFFIYTSGFLPGMYNGPEGYEFQRFSGTIEVTSVWVNTYTEEAYWIGFRYLNETWWISVDTVGIDPMDFIWNSRYRPIICLSFKVFATPPGKEAGEHQCLQRLRKNLGCS
ncbi:hypothetical protein KC640_03375, partial [Candidatus Dojkabacteria bacterium]|nr:hypothetical protein [Candidatus Dojkabacteria bacterium]